jgi:hypothetical protein
VFGRPGGGEIYEGVSIRRCTACAGVVLERRALRKIILREEVALSGEEERSGRALLLGRADPARCIPFEAITLVQALKGLVDESHLYYRLEIETKYGERIAASCPVRKKVMFQGVPPELKARGEQLAAAIGCEFKGGLI